MQEQWKPVEGYEGLYEVSDQGNIRRVRTTYKRPLRKIVQKSGQRVVVLSKNSERATFTVAQLVAKAFLPPKTEERIRFVLHKDGDPGNNRADNLEWSAAPLPTKKVEMLKDGHVVQRYSSITAAADAAFRSFSALSSCLNGKSKTCGGYQWRYAQEETE